VRLHRDQRGAPRSIEVSHTGIGWAKIVAVLVRWQLLAGRCGIDAEHPQTNAVVVGGHAYFKSDAVVQVLGRLPHWPWTAVFKLKPWRFRDWLYDRLAGNRHRLFGKTETLLAPASDIAFRFISDAGPSG